MFKHLTGTLTTKEKCCVGIVFFGLAIVWIFKADFAKFLGYLIAGLFLIGQISASNRRATAAEKTAEDMQKTTELTEKGHIHERFRIAIEHLGADSSSVRLGGIYALHHLAKDVVEYRGRVFEILCSHIRGSTATKNLDQDGELIDSVEPTIEIQSILNLLFVKDRGGEIYQEFQANLDSANLKWTVLNNSMFESASLYKTSLVGATLNESSLKNSVLDHADLHLSSLVGVDLRNAELNGVDLRSANLENAKLHCANLRYANLEGVESLEIEQLLKVNTLYGAKLPNEMEEDVRRIKPELLENPFGMQ